MTDKKHHTKRPEAHIKRGLDRKGYTHATALNQILFNRNVQYCMDILSGERAPARIDVQKLVKALGVKQEDLE